MSTSNDPQRVRVAIIGAGVGGIITGHHLLERGDDDFVILEKDAGVGGTWQRNRYPGLECDVPSHLYSFSFRLKPDWSKPYGTQPEILAYLQECVEEFGLMPYIRLNSGVALAAWNEDDSTWVIDTTDGKRIVADALISGTGMFGATQWPKIDGLDSFTGTLLHTAEWPQGQSLAGKRVAVIGTAASAVQMIPEIVKETGQLYVFQRSAAWVLPKQDTPFTAEQLEHFRNSPETVKAMRAEILKIIGPSRPFVNPEQNAQSTAAGIANISVVNDPVLREKLTPTTPWGCQRPLFSNLYYPVYNRPDVELITDSIVRVTPNGVVTEDGIEREVDTIICATGYDTLSYASRVPIVGRDGVSLSEAWKDGAIAYLGCTTVGFPNFFMLYGPNTNAGSLIYMIESESRYALRMLKAMEDKGITTIEVRPDVMHAYDEQLQRDNAEIEAWGAGCHNYYRVPNGRIVTQYPHSMYTFEERLDADDLSSFITT